MVQDNIMVSIYCKAYNHEKYIRDCLNGFVNQKTSFKYEVIIHDDASTDKTADIIREYQAKYPDIIRPIFQKENQYSQNIPVFSSHMLPMMRGKYIACCEGDDYWTSENKLQMQVDFLEANQAYSACVHSTKVMNMSNGRVFVNYPKGTFDLEVADVVRESMRCYHTSSLVYRIEYAYNRPEFLTRRTGVGDYPLSIYLAMQGKIHYFGDEVMSVYRYGTEGSWTSRMANDNKKKIANCRARIEMLNMADEYSGGAYGALFQDKIKQYECNMLIAEGKFHQLKHGETAAYYKKYPVKIKVKVMLLQYCPKLYWRVRKLKKFYI